MELKTSTLLILNINRQRNMKFKMMMILIFVLYFHGIWDQYFLICFVEFIFWTHKKLLKSLKIRLLHLKQSGVIYHFLQNFRNIWVKCFIIILKKELSFKQYLRTHIFLKPSVNISKITNKNFMSRRHQCKKI